MDLSGSGSRRRRKIHFQNGHLESVGHFAVLVVPEDHADELAADMDFGGILLLRALQHRDGIEPEQVSKVFFDAPDF